ncbi:unnamed protein product, partial [Rotaria magnacalcarata]
SIAECYVRDTWDVEFVKMKAIMQRPELVAYYNRRGYIDTGQREPFPKGDERSGIPKVQDLEVCILKKYVKLS